MIIRRATTSLRSLPPTPSASHLRLLSSSSTTSASPRRDDRRSVRGTRFTKPRPTSRAPPQTELVPAPKAAEVEAVPSTSKEPSFPWAAYNAGPTHLEGADVPTEPPSVAAVPVVVPRDEEGVLDNAVGDASERARTLFSVSAIVVVRQMEMLNVLLGYEQANK